MTTAITTVPTDNAVSPLGRMAEARGVSKRALLDALTATVMGKLNPTEPELLAFLMVCDHYGLDPIRKEVFAMEGRSGIVPVLSVDGWAAIIARDKRVDGFTFAETNDAAGELVSCSCTMFIKGRGHATTVTESLKECKRPTDPWRSMPRRMLRHKALMQCGRIVLGLSGLCDIDEAEDIRTGGPSRPDAPPTGSTTARARAALEASRAPVGYPAGTTFKAGTLEPVYPPSGDPDAIVEAELAGTDPVGTTIPAPTPAPAAPAPAGRPQTPPGGTDAAGGSGGASGGTDTLDCGGGWTRIVVQGAVPGNSKNAAKSAYMNVLTTDGAKYTTFSTRLIPVLAAAREDGEYAYILTDKEGKIVEVRRDPPEPELLG